MECSLLGWLIMFGMAVVLLNQLSYLYLMTSNTYLSRYTTNTSDTPRYEDGPCSGPFPHPMPPFKLRNDLGNIVEDLNLTTGVELGVKGGIFAAEMLKRWPSCKEYHLVDIWAQQDNYKDDANVGDEKQEWFYQKTLTRTKLWADKITICRNFTSNCVLNYPNGYFDFIYVDARHDFKGVYEDLVDWWPKLRRGGIISGHDFITQDDGPAQGKQDWTVNYDGTKDETGTVVKGAVEKFSAEVCRQITVEYRASGWNTWALRK